MPRFVLCAMSLVACASAFAPIKRALPPPTRKALSTRGGGGSASEALEITWDDTPVRGKGEEYEVQNLLFEGMVRNMRDGSGLAPTLLGLVALGCKLILGHVMVFSSYTNAVPLTETWANLFSDAYTPHARWGVAVALVAAPAKLLQSLSEASELKDSAVYYSALRALGGGAGGRPSAAYCFWLVVHVLRVYVVLPLFVLANAAVMAAASDFSGLFFSTFAASLVLQLDDTFYWLYEQLAGARGTAVSKHVALDAETKQATDRVVREKVAVIAVAQFALLALLKTSAFGGEVRLLWALPVLGGLLGVTYRAYSRHLSLKAGLIVAVELAWMALLHANTPKFLASLRASP